MDTNFCVNKNVTYITDAVDNCLDLEHSFILQKQIIYM